MSVVAILPAAGSGKRIASTKPKQFLKFRGKELIVYALEVFQKNPKISGIIIAAAEEYIPLLDRLRRKYGISKIEDIVEGGKERQDSVYNALASLRLQSNDLVAVHDAARPLLSQAVLNNAIKTAKEKGSAVVCLTGRDTLLRVTGSDFEYIDRTNVHYVQTPQIFRYADLFETMRRAQTEKLSFSDESSLMKNYGFPVTLTEGSMLNFKVTTKNDLTVLREIVRE
jgi:2-C-methyl-D-erythritol 4-phosphate cytidylyltransferase